MRLAASVRKQQLIETAIRLFSEQGFDGTTTHQIANAAGINEAIIFRHFKSKEELYWAVVSSRVSAARKKRKLYEFLDGENHGSNRDDREALAAVATRLLDRSKDDAQLTRLLIFSSLKNPELSEDFFRTYVAEQFELLSRFFRKGIKQGRFRNIDPDVAARGFLGMVVYHYLIKELFGGKRYLRFDSRVLGEQLADMWLNGISSGAKPNRKNGVKAFKEMGARPRFRKMEQTEFWNLYEGNSLEGRF